MKKTNSNIKGVSLLEALVSTAVIGIGFIAILQMTNYSVQSIHTSGERTKANFLTNMIAEDALASKDPSSGSAVFADFLSGESGESETDLATVCSTGGTSSTNSGNIYGTTVDGLRPSNYHRGVASGSLMPGGNNNPSNTMTTATTTDLNHIVNDESVSYTHLTLPTNREV